MRIPTLLLAAATAAALSFSVSAHAATDTFITEAPPEPIYEVDLGKRPGYILSPGYWRWDGNRHLWVPNRWIKERDGYIWQPDVWEQRGDKWQLVAGHWDKDELVEDDTVELPEAAEATAAKPKKKFKKRKKIDYSDPRQYPRYIKR